MIYFYCTSWQFFHIIVKWRISPTTEQIMFTFSILLFHFYSHIPCGMWLSYIWSIKITKIISTHTSRVGCDQSRWWLQNPCTISTHTSRVGCDICVCGQRRCCDISTHTSRVGCDKDEEDEESYRIFLLTHPVWDVTTITEDGSPTQNISTHISRVGCDQFHCNSCKYEW